MKFCGGVLNNGGYDSAGLEPDHVLLPVTTVTYWKQLSHHLLKYSR